MIVVNTHEAKTQLSKLLTEIELHHQTVRICRNGKPIADIVPINKRKDILKLHKELQGVKILYDPTAPLDEEDWPGDSR